MDVVVGALIAFGISWVFYQWTSWDLETKIERLERVNTALANKLNDMEKTAITFDEFGKVLGNMYDETGKVQLMVVRDEGSDKLTRPDSEELPA